MLELCSPSFADEMGTSDRGGDKQVWLNEYIIAKMVLLFTPYLGLSVNSCYLLPCLLLADYQSVAKTVFA